MSCTNTIEQKIKELYGSKASFCDLHGHKYKDFASKLRTFENRVNWLNQFIEPLELEIQIVPIAKSEEENNKLRQILANCTLFDYIKPISQNENNRGK